MNAAENSPPSRGLAGLCVLSLESRRAPEMAKLIASYGGEPLVAPSMREAPLESNAEAQAFVRALVDEGFDVVIFLTGVGTRALAHVADSLYPRERWLAALGRAAIVARGPKPVAALTELGVPVAIAVPEPNTWRELLRALDDRPALLLRGRRVAVQEYGAPNPELLSGLAERGARVTRVPVYEWTLPEDTGPLRDAVEALAAGRVDVALFTTSVQIAHLLRIAAEMHREAALRDAFARVAIGSIGPVTSEALREHGLVADFEPEHPKMGFLVRAAAERCREVLEKKRASR